jgi:hypothetical protein
MAPTNYKCWDNECGSEADAEHVSAGTVAAAAENFVKVFLDGMGNRDVAVRDPDGQCYLVDVEVLMTPSYRAGKPVRLVEDLPPRKG